MKIFASVFLTIFLFTTSLNAASLGKTLSKKQGQEFTMYNIFIDNYNKFKKDFNQEVLRFCKNQVNKSLGIRQLTAMSKCQYNAAVDLLSKHSLNTDPLSEIVYSWHTHQFPAAKNTVVGILGGASREKAERMLDDYFDNNSRLLTRLFRDLDDGAKQLALMANAKHLEKNKKEGLPNVKDNEIIAASSGTGFYVSKNGHMITNNHVIDGCKNIKTIFDGNEYEAKVLAVDKMNDLAIIQSNAKPKLVYKVSSKDAGLLEEVIVAGYPLGKKVSAAIKATSGTVTAMAGIGDNYAEFQTDAALNSGNSGGPIIDENGNVVGVAVSKIQQEGVESFNFGVKSSVLKIFANANNLKFDSQNNRAMKKKDLGKLITEATVYIECWMTGKQIKQLISQKNSRKAFYSEFLK